jgi:hypothetical protein
MVHVQHLCVERYSAHCYSPHWHSALKEVKTERRNLESHFQESIHHKTRYHNRAEGYSNAFTHKGLPVVCTTQQ